MSKSSRLNRLRNTLTGEFIKTKEGIAKDNIEDKYYVYTLTTTEEGAIPFYIGKGKGERAFDHEHNAQRIIRKIRDAGGELDNEVSEKIATIIKNKKIKKTIIKWGLTEKEAYMCESSLINLIDYLFPGKLTNIQNGHASEKEKNSKPHTTKAYELSDFIDKVCIEETEYEQSLLAKKKIVFLKVQSALSNYEKDNKKGNKICFDDYVYQCAQGCWAGSIDRLCDAEYVVALQNMTIRGIYPVDKWMTVKQMINSNQFPDYPLSSRGEDKKKKDKAFLSKKCFIKKNDNQLTDEEKKEYTKLKEKFLNTVITDNNGFLKKQNGRYNYEKNGKIKESL